jgi:hypothetical protein
LRSVGSNDGDEERHVILWGYEEKEKKHSLPFFPSFSTRFFQDMLRNDLMA